MRHLVRLIRNELLKMIHRTSTLMMSGGMVAVILLTFAMDRWYNPFNIGFWSAVAGQSWVSIFITVITVILASRIIADEFQWGTIKLLLIRPVSRSTILFAKYCTVLSYGFFMLAMLFIFSLVLNGIFLPRNMPDPSLFSAGEAGLGGSPGMVLKLYALRMVEIGIYAGIAFMISTLFKSVALATGITFFLMVFGPEIGNQLGASGWNRFFLFHHTGLSRYAQPNPTEALFTLSESLGIVFIHELIFYGIAWFRFTKQDVF